MTPNSIVTGSSETALRFPKYVRSIQRESAAAHAELAAIRSGLDRLQAHLSSAKFSGPGQQWIATADVHAWLTEIRNDAMFAAECAA